MTDIEYPTVECKVEIEQCADGSVTRLAVTSPKTGNVIVAGHYGLYKSPAMQASGVMWSVERAGWKKRRTMRFSAVELKALHEASQMVPPGVQQSRKMLAGLREEARKIEQEWEKKNGGSK